MIAFRQGLPINVENIKTDTAGRFLIVQIKYEEQKFILCNLYAPNRDYPGFFADCFREISKFDGRRIIIGDFNLALNPVIDRKTTKHRSANNDASKEIVKNYMENSLLSDIWRERHPDLQHFTWRHTKPYVS